jgi:hypothetical protein
MTPVGFGLRMDTRIAVYLGGGGLEDTGPNPLGQSKAVDRSDHRGLHRLDGVVLVVRRRRRAGEIVNPVDLKLKRVDNIVPHKLEVGISKKMLDVGLATGEEIIKADDFVPLLDKAVTEVGPKESGSAGNEDTHRIKI